MNLKALICHSDLIYSFYSLGVAALYSDYHQAHKELTPIAFNLLIVLLKPILTDDPDQNLLESYTAGLRQVWASRHRSSGPDTGSNS